MVVERELRSRFVAEGLVGFIGAKVAVFDKNGLLAIGKLECVDPHHLNLYLRHEFVLLQQPGQCPVSYMLPLRLLH